MNLSEHVQSSFAETEGVREQEDPGKALERRGQEVQSSYRISTGGGALTPSNCRWGYQGPEKEDTFPSVTQQVSSRS